MRWDIINSTTWLDLERDFAAALTEWERRYREEPDRFMSDTQRLARSADEYGDACAPYLLDILAGQAKARRPKRTKRGSTP